MSPKNDDFLDRLRDTFKVEASEHLQAIATGLLELEGTPPPPEQRSLIETVFRAAHSLKGAARAVDFTEIESLCQSLEDRLASWKREAPVPSGFDTVHRLLNAIAAALAAPAASTPSTPALPVPAPPPDAWTPPPFVKPPPPETPAPAPSPREPAPFPPAPERKPSSPEETVRITVAKLDARLVEAEELLTAKLTTAQRAEDLRELAECFTPWKDQWAAVEPETISLRQSIERPATGPATAPHAPGLPRLLEFFDWNLRHLKALESRVEALTRTAQQDRHVIGKLVDDLLEDSKKLLLLPFATLAAPFPKLVRDLCRDQGKEADLVVHGEEVEIDKRILEEMKDPLIHLLRNGVDHGVETPDRRVRLGKPPRATLTLAASPASDNKVEIVVSDDGAGLSIQKIKESAIKHNLLPAEDARRLGDEEARMLIFQTEISTSPIITRLSGRGLGLAIVREKAEKLGGSVSVESQPGQGTRFRIVLPSMLATFRGILIETAKQLFVVPTFHVERAVRVQTDAIRTVEGRETMALNNRAIPLVRLADVLELPAAETHGEPPAFTTVLVLGTGDQRVAFIVDAVLDEQEVLVKPLRKPLSRVRHIAGATVLGSGRVAPVLNGADLLKSAKKTGGLATRAAVKTRREEGKSILIAEDSITSRMLIKSIVESAGYQVKTAVDGMEAFTLLCAETFDLVVSDVEMPRLNGFDLTARIRATRNLAELPVVLVTALETREDRERGIDVGANAYIIKSSFDQSNLLDAIRRLV